MSTVYKHGVYVYQQPTSIKPPRIIGAALPVVVGTAPVHMVRAGYTGPINEPYMAYTHKDAVTTFGDCDDADWGKWTLCEATYIYFELYAVAPVIFINVFDPAIHKTSVTGEAHTFAGGRIALAHPGLVAAPVVKSEDGTTTYAAGTDYTVGAIAGEIEIVTGGALADSAKVQVDYVFGDPSLVDADDIIGGIDAATGAKSGLELVDEVFPRLREVPGIILVPGWSHNLLVSMVMTTKADNINGIFSAYAYTDLPSGQEGEGLKYQDMPAWKNDNNYVEVSQYCSWPKVRAEDKIMWMSTHMAALTGSVDADNEDIPYESPSNKALKANGACLSDGTPVHLGLAEANYLNSHGIVTPLNWIGGWRAWGNRTGCYPANTDIKDNFLAVQRMFRWIGNIFILTEWQEVDRPINRRLIETIVDSFNIWLNGLTARQFLLGGRIEFRRDENPVLDVMDGIIKFHLSITPPSPAREIVGILEYDPAYINVLFGDEA